VKLLGLDLGTFGHAQSLRPLLDRFSLAPPLHTDPNQNWWERAAFRSRSSCNYRTSTSGAATH